MSLYSPIAAIRSTLTDDRTELRAAVDRIPADLRSTKPAPGRWSVAEVIEHLAIVEQRSVAALSALISGAPLRDTTRSDGPTPLDRTALRDRGIKVAAPDPILPTGTLDADAAWAALEHSRAELLALLDSAEGKDLREIGRTHPRLGHLDGYQWLASIGGHEERHTLQIQEIADALGVK